MAILWDFDLFKYSECQSKVFAGSCATIQVKSSWQFASFQFTSVQIAFHLRCKEFICWFYLLVFHLPSLCLSFKQYFIHLSWEIGIFSTASSRAIQPHIVYIFFCFISDILENIFHPLETFFVAAAADPVLNLCGGGSLLLWRFTYETLLLNVN